MAVPDLCPECQAFVRLDWTTKCGACGANLLDQTNQAPVARPTNNGAPKGPGNIVAALAVAVAVLVIGGVVGVVAFVGESPSTKNLAAGSAANEAFNAAASSIGATNDPDAIADRLQLPDGSMNTKWTKLGYEHTPKSELNSAVSCFTNDPLMSNSASTVAEYTYNLQGDGTEGGHMTYRTRISDSASIADHQHQRINSADYEPCEISAAKDVMKVAGMVATADLARVKRNLPVAYVDYRVTGTALSAAGLSHPVVETIFLQHGRARLRIEFLDCQCKLGPPPDKDAIINAGANQLLALPES